MQVEVDTLYNLEVYTPKGLYLGRISEILIDIKTSAVYEFILSDTNPTIVDDSRSIGIPFRWVSTIKEIVVLKYFPGKIHITQKLSRYRKKRRKLRVLKRKFKTYGVSREPWIPPRTPSRRRKSYTER
jgi:sporulation protein YlmC with PRC-barrel domain